MLEGEQDTHYSMVLEWEPVGNAFVVTVPELRGCRTHGRTYEEAVRQGQDAIATWIEAARLDRERIPEPRTFAIRSAEQSVR